MLLPFLKNQKNLMFQPYPMNHSHQLFQMNQKLLMRLMCLMMRLSREFQMYHLFLKRRLLQHFLMFLLNLPQPKLHMFQQHQSKKQSKLYMYRFLDK
jgi:hypothetical protein